MRALVVRRVLNAIVVTMVAITITFFLAHAAPGDPIGSSLDDPHVSEATRTFWRHRYGLDRPIPMQYLSYLSASLRGDFGYSLTYNEPVSEVVARALPNTCLLAGTALLASFVIGILIALAQVARSGSLLDRGLGAILLALYSMPDFWLAQLALLLFAYWLPILPAGGVVDPVLHPYMGVGDALLDRLRHMVLPVATLTALSTAAVARFQRAALLDVSAEDYLRTARAKGLPERSVILHHALRNALLPVITLFGLSLPGFLAGTTFVEKVFSWPGIGALAVDSVAARDYPVIIACTVIASIAVTVGSLIADLLYFLADPRLRYPALQSINEPEAG